MLLNVPNILTLSRIFVIPVVLGFMYAQTDMGNWIAFWAYTYAAVTDFFDGYLARVWEQQSAFGRFLDPIADKLLVAGVLLMLVGVGTIEGLEILAASIILCREILVSGLREFMAEAKVGMPVSLLAKWKTTIQLLALGFLIVGDAGPYLWIAETKEVGVWGIWIAAIITVITGIDYLRAGLKYIQDADSQAEKG